MLHDGKILNDFWRDIIEKNKESLALKMRRPSNVVICFVSLTLSSVYLIDRYMTLKFQVDSQVISASSERSQGNESSNNGNIKARQRREDEKEYEQKRNHNDILKQKWDVYEQKENNNSFLKQGEDVHQQKGSHNNFLKQREDVYAQRNEIIRQGCEYYKANDMDTYRALSEPTYFQIKINHEHKLLWCKIAKAGSSSWTYNFNILKKNRNKTFDEEAFPSFDDIIESTEKTFTFWKAFRKSGYISFRFTRHPFTRILSAYRGKLENATSKWTSAIYHKRHGQKIVTLYRSEEDKKTMQREECTFSEFVQYLLDGNINDQHWKPASSTLYPCGLVYNVPGAVESFDDDSNYVITKSNLETLIEPVWKNKQKKEDDLQRKYYSLLSRDQLERLYKVYEPDFRLFGYDALEYFQYVKS